MNTETFVKGLLNRLSTNIAHKFSINERELRSIRGDNTVNTCMFYSAKTRGCKAEAFKNGYCGKHQSHAVVMESTVNSAATRVKKFKPKELTKTEKDYIARMNTAVPQVVTVLTPCEHGLLEKVTGLVFDKEYNVIGSNGKKLSKLTPYDVEQCEIHAWAYSDSILEYDSD